MTNKFLEMQLQIALDATFPDASERSKFPKWYTDLDVVLAKTSERSIIKQPMDAKQYRQILIGVNWSSLDAIDVCYKAIYGSGQRLAAEPIYLGQDNQIFYYLQPQMVFIDSQQDLKEDAKAHPYILEMRPSTGRTVPFRFGFCLGTLKYAYSTSVSSEPLRLTMTPFHVYLDVEPDLKDIWIVFSTEYLNELNEEVELDSQTNVWEHLPSPQNGRDIFRAMKVSDLDRLFKPDQQQPFFSQRIGGQGFGTLLRPWVAELSKVAEATKRGGSSSSTP